MAKNTTKKKRREYRGRADVEKRLNDYFAALGQFVTAYAHVETVMYFVLVWYAGITHKAAKAVFSGTRMDAASGYLRRMHELKLITANEWKHLERCLTQIGHISAARNLILHYGIEDAGTKRAKASNYMRAMSRQKARSVPATIKHLEDMNEDLIVIAQVLFIHNRGAPYAKGQYDEFRDWLYGPWRYTPPPPKQRRRRPGGKSAKQPRLP